MQRGAGRGPHIRTDHDTYSGSYHRAADRNFHVCADPGAYLDSDLDAGHDLHACTDLSAYSDHSAGRLLARR